MISSLPFPISFLKYYLFLLYTFLSPFDLFFLPFYYRIWIQEQLFWFRSTSGLTRTLYSRNIFSGITKAYNSVKILLLFLLLLLLYIISIICIESPIIIIIYIFLKSNKEKEKKENGIVVSAVTVTGKIRTLDECQPQTQLYI